MLSFWIGVSTTSRQRVAPRSTSTTHWATKSVPLRGSVWLSGRNHDSRGKPSQYHFRGSLWLLNPLARLVWLVVKIGQVIPLAVEHVVNCTLDALLVPQPTLTALERPGTERMRP